MNSAVNYLFRFKSIALLLIFSARSLSGSANVAPQRIITLSAAISETVWALGYGKFMVATDATSLYPAEVKNLPKVSKNRSLSAEVLVSYAPDLVLAPAKDISATMRSQLKNAGINLVTIEQDFSPAGATIFIKSIARALGDPQKGNELAARTQTALNQVLAQVKASKSKPKKVLFIYARGAATMTVAGNGSQMAEIINLAGSVNAVKEFSDYKPYSTETMIRTNPDVILMFDFGLSSLGGVNNILKMPGVMHTNAGKKGAIVQVDGPLMVNFSVRLPEAVRVLHQKLSAW